MALDGTLRSSAVTFPRAVAVQALTAVLSDGQALDQALERLSQQHSLDPQARGWLVDVASGVLRWKGRLDLAVDSIALKKKPSGWLRKILLVAAYQLIVQERVAAALVVSETVTEVKKRDGEAPAKFANAALRKIAETAKQWRELPFPQKGSLQEQAAWASMQDWFWKGILKARGLEWSRQFAQATLERPKLWLRLPPGGEPSEDGSRGPVPGSFTPSEGGSITERAGFTEGQFFVQDISSQILVHGIAEAVLSVGLRSRPQALDLCAAPGGKALGLAWKGLEVRATDIDAKRLAMIRENIRRLRSDVQVIDPNEVASLPSQDLVWVDAPCTGSGIIRRHPDVRWLRKEKDLHSLTSTQLELLKNAWEKVTPGGYLAYSVCSVFEEEGERMIEQSGLSSKIQKSWLLAPHLDPGGDGFWAALLRKDS